MYVFSTCSEWLRTVPNLPYSMKKPEDVDSDAEDHSYDATRYSLMDHPIAPKKKPTKSYKSYDPFERGDEFGS